MRFARTAIAALVAGSMLAGTAGTASADAWNSGGSINWNALQQGTGDDCDPAVRQQQQLMQIAQIDGGVAIAKQFYDVLPSGSFNQMSCLDRLFNGVGLNIIFNPPNLDAIMRTLQGMICNMFSSVMSQGTRYLTQSLGGSLPIGQVIPGLNLGSLGMGVSVHPAFGNSNGSLVNSNINSVLSQPYSYAPTSQPTLFGNTNY